MIPSVSVQFHIHVTGVKRKKHTDGFIGINEFSQMNPVHPFFYRSMGDFIADGGIITYLFCKSIFSACFHTSIPFPEREAGFTIK